MRLIKVISALALSVLAAPTASDGAEGPLSVVVVPLSLSELSPFVWTNAIWWTNSPAPTNIETWQAWWAQNENWGRLTNWASSVQTNWHINGNTLGTNTFFLGSIDNRQLQFRVNSNQVALFSTLPSVALGNGAVASSAESICIGDAFSSASAANAIAIGPSCNATAAGAVGIGYNTLSSGLSSVALAGTASGDFAVAISTKGSAGAQAPDSFCALEGSVTGAAAQYGVALGVGCTASGVSSYALGLAATANNDGSFVWSDSNGAGFADTAANQFIAYAAGGFYLNSAGAGIHLDGQVYSGNTINATNTTGNSFTEYVPENMAGVAAAQSPLGNWASLSAFGTNLFAPATVTANTYYRLTNYVYGVTNRWALSGTRTNGLMVNTHEGWYRINFSVSGYGNTGNELEADIVTNNVTTDAIAAHWTTAVGSKSASGSGTGILYLPAGTTVGIAIKNIDSTSLTVTHAQLTCGTP